MVQANPHRPGSSMSISSMLGGDPEATTREAMQSRSSMPASAHNASTSAGLQQRPPPPYSGTPQPGPRARTPDTFPSWSGDQNRPARAYSGGTPQRPYSSYQESPPETTRFGPPLQTHQAQYVAHNPDSIAQRDVYGPHRRPSVGSLGTPTSARPLSLAQSPIDYEPSRTGRPTSAAIERTGPTSAEHNAVPRSSTAHPDSRHRDRPDSSDKAYLYSSEPRSHNSPRQQGPNIRDGQSSAPNHPHYPFISRHQPQQAHNDRRIPGREDNSIMERGINSPPNRRFNPPQQHGDGFDGQRGPKEVEKPSEQDLRLHEELRQVLIPTLGAHGNHPRDSNPVLSARSAIPPSAALEQHIAGGDDSTPQSRLSLGLFTEQKRGRISPLPQAMQGAQARLRGPTGEPGIKNEFGRIFPGLGSGVGSAMSTPVPPENQPPQSFPPSPAPGDELARRTPLGIRAELGESRSRNASKTGRKGGRKAKEDDVKREADLDGIGSQGLTRTLSGRVLKRSRQSYQSTSSPFSHQ